MKSHSLKSQVQSPPKPLEINACLLEESISTKHKQPPEPQQPLPEIKSLEATRSFMHSQMEMSSGDTNKKEHLQIQINKSHKFTEGWSTVIKYEILTPNQEHQPILRRYSEFCKLKSYLSEKYKGTFIPELPPKEYFGGSIWTADTTFLEDRRVGLELFLNKVLGHELLGSDSLVLRFIDDQSVDETNYGQEGMISTADKYLKTLLSITTSTSQIKDYGMAYYSYIKSSIVEEIPPRLN